MEFPDTAPYITHYSSLTQRLPEHRRQKLDYPSQNRVAAGLQPNKDGRMHSLSLRNPCVESRNTSKMHTCSFMLSVTPPRTECLPLEWIEEPPTQCLSPIWFEHCSGSEVKLIRTLLLLPSSPPPVATLSHGGEHQHRKETTKGGHTMLRKPSDLVPALWRFQQSHIPCIPV